MPGARVQRPHQLQAAAGALLSTGLVATAAEAIDEGLAGAEYFAVFNHAVSSAL